MSESVRVARLGAAASALALALAGAAAAEPWEGIWAAKPEWCGGEGEGSAITITAEAVEGLENRCDITNVSPLGVGDSWRVDQFCTGEGMTDRASEIFLLTSEGALVRYTDEGMAVWMTRCP